MLFVDIPLWRKITAIQLKQVITPTVEQNYLNVQHSFSLGIMFRGIDLHWMLLWSFYYYVWFRQQAGFAIAQPAQSGMQNAKLAGWQPCFLLRSSSIIPEGGQTDRQTEIYVQTYTQSILWVSYSYKRWLSYNLLTTFNGRQNNLHENIFPVCTGGRMQVHNNMFSTTSFRHK